MNVELIVFKDNYIAPKRGHDIDVGLDVAAPEAGVLLPGPNVIGVGFGLKVPVGYNVSVYPRTGMVSGQKTLDMKVANTFLTVKDVHPNGISLAAQHPPIDPGYAGEIHVIVINHSDLTVEYERGTRFGQLVCHPIAYINPVSNIDETRGAGWAGSTGIK
jgi:dUTP pyrophosphatase